VILRCLLSACLCPGVLDGRCCQKKTPVVDEARRTKSSDWFDRSVQHC